MADLSNRRPLASRQSAWATRITRWLAGTSVTPNQISIASMVAALGAGAAFWAAGGSTGWGRALLLVLAACLCQLRLLCNLLDGMIAVEAGRGGPDGGFWNEFTDHISVGRRSRAWLGRGRRGLPDSLSARVACQLRTVR